MGDVDCHSGEATLWVFEYDVLDSDGEFVVYLDGDFVSDFDGDFDGDFDDNFVGDCDSSFMGDFDGDFVLGFVGNFVGEFDGDSVEIISARILWNVTCRGQSNFHDIITMTAAISKCLLTSTMCCIGILRWFLRIPEHETVGP